MNEEQKGQEIGFVKEAYESNWMSAVGSSIDEAERLICDKTGCRYAVALATGTAALHMAIKLTGIKPGDKVFCSDLTFSATVNPVKYEGGEAVFIDTGCFISVGAVVNYGSMCCDGVHVDCNGVVAGGVLVPVGTKVESGTVYQKGSIDIKDLFAKTKEEDWIEKQREQFGKDPNLFDGV